MISTNPPPPPFSPSPFHHLFVAFCDRDANWGPLLFLRPDRKQRISTLRNVAGALLLGLPFGLLGTILVTLLMRMMEKPAPALMYFPLVLTLVYTVIGRVTVVRAWNDRANRLARWPTHR